MRDLNLNRRHLLQAGAATLAAPWLAHAQASWPTKALRVVVPFTPGGTTDFVTRLVTTELGRALHTDLQPAEAGRRCEPVWIAFGELLTRLVAPAKLKPELRSALHRRWRRKVQAREDGASLRALTWPILAARRCVVASARALQELVCGGEARGRDRGGALCAHVILSL